MLAVFLAIVYQVLNLSDPKVRVNNPPRLQLPESPRAPPYTDLAKQLHSFAQRNPKGFRVGYG